MPVVHTVTLGEIADTIRSFRASRGDRSVLDMGDPFTKKLYSTCLSCLPEDQFSYEQNEMIVKIDLKERENEQTIFDKVNSAGV